MNAEEDSRDCCLVFCVPCDVHVEELERSDAVFTGKVIEIQEKKQLNGLTKKYVLFEVKKTWKGISQSQVILTTGMGGGDCGYEFEERP